MNNSIPTNRTKRLTFSFSKNSVYHSDSKLAAVFTPSQGFFNFLVYIRPRVVRYFAGKKKSRRESVDSFSSNGIHVSGISAVSGTSSVENRRDVSMKSEDLKLMDPFMKSAPEKSDESEQSTVKTRFDTSLDEAASDGKNEN